MGIAEPVIGRAFARPVGSTHPTNRNQALPLDDDDGFASLIRKRRDRANSELYYRESECSRKKRSISLVASGPRGSV
jgi:exonuclease I